MLTQLRNRGLRDILIACCDGLTGLPDAITTVFPQTVVQTCVVHVIRNAMRFVSYTDRKKIAASMRTIYTAPSVEAAEEVCETGGWEITGWDVATVQRIAPSRADRIGMRGTGR